MDDSLNTAPDATCGLNKQHAEKNSAVSSTTEQFKQQLPRNVLLQGLSFITNVAIGIWLVPYLVGHLGRAAYGLIPMAGAMTQYVSLISGSISNAVTRFLTMALQRNNSDDANRVFNTAFFSYLAIGLIQIPIFGLIINYANTIFSIPEELYRDAIILFLCSATSFLASLACSVFSVPMYANNRLDISRGIDIARLILRLAGIVTLFTVFGPALRYVGYVDLLLTILMCTTNVVITKRLAPTLKLALCYYDWNKVRELTAMGGWLLVHNVGALLFLRVDIWICNRFIGAEEAGDYAAVLQWSNLIRQAGTVLAGVTIPMLMICYARSEMERLIRLSKLTVRIFLLLMAIPISLLCVFSQPLLRLWLGDSFARLWPLMVIMLCHLGINVAVMPLFNIQVAVNRVALPGFVTLIMGMVNFVLAIFLAKYVGWGIYGVAIAGAITLTVKNALFTPIYGAIILRQPWHAFLGSYLSGLAFFAGLLSLEWLVEACVHPKSWLHLGVIFMLAGMIGLVAAWLALAKQDRRIVVDLVPARLRNIVRFVPA